MELFANMSKWELKLVKHKALKLEKENHSLFERVRKQKEDFKKSTKRINDLQQSLQDLTTNPTIILA
jgi:hypothetical protein